MAQNIITDQKNNREKISPESLVFLNYIMNLKQKVDLNTQQEEVEERSLTLRTALYANVEV